MIEITKDLTGHIRIRVLLKQTGYMYSNLFKTVFEALEFIKVNKLIEFVK
jgi:hypothetical protein